MRWKLEGGDGQESLFAADVEHHVGRGEYRGMEFLQVRAQRVINTLPKSGRLPFRHTINAYRGCTHACAYCQRGEAQVLMADGRTRQLADLRAGDEVVGTEVVGHDRRYVTTTVLDHWSVVKTAWRVGLDDGTDLVTSGDHRFLSDRGWKHVTGAAHGRDCRHRLTTDDRLLGPGRFEEGPEGGDDYRQGYLCGTTKGLTAIRTQAAAPVQRSILGRAVRNSPTRRMTSIEPLGIDIPLYDITTGTGDYIADGVISHNCFARPTHDYLGLDIGDGFDRQIVVKVNAVERLRAELDPRRWCGEPIAMGTNTDPYQKAEGKYHLTRGLVEALAEAGNPFSLLTKSTLVLRDLDLLVEASARTEVSVNFSIGTLDEEVWRATEPGTPPPQKRVEALARLRDAGVRCGVLVAPVLPGLSDSAGSIDDVVSAVTAAGASTVAGGMLVYLKPGVREVFLGRLATTHPELIPRYEALYPRTYAPKAEQQRVSALLAESTARHRGVRVAVRANRATGHLTAPTPSPPPSPASTQLGLGL